MIDWLQEVTSEVHRGEITVDKYLERYTKVMRASLTGELVAQSGCIVRYRPRQRLCKIAISADDCSDWWSCCTSPLKCCPMDISGWFHAPVNDIDSINWLDGLDTKEPRTRHWYPANPKLSR
jgi:hypothetical protein